MVPRKHRAIARAKRDHAEVISTTANTITSSNTDDKLDRGVSLGDSNISPGKIKKTTAAATPKEMMATTNRHGGGVSGRGRENNIDTVNITKNTSVRFSSKKDSGDNNGLVSGESRGTMTAAAHTNSVPGMSSALTTSLYPHPSLLRAVFDVPASVTTDGGCLLMAVCVLVGNRDVSPPMNSTEEDEEDEDNGDGGEMSGEVSLLVAHFNVVLSCESKNSLTGTSLCETNDTSFDKAKFSIIRSMSSLAVLTVPFSLLHSYAILIRLTNFPNFP